MQVLILPLKSELNTSICSWKPLIISSSVIWPSSSIHFAFFSICRTCGLLAHLPKLPSSSLVNDRTTALRAGLFIYGAISDTAFWSAPSTCVVRRRVLIQQMSWLSSRTASLYC